MSETNAETTIQSSDKQEIADLHNAIGKVLDKIRWHENQIEQSKNDIKNHENQISDLRSSIRQNVGPLMNETLNQPTIEQVQRRESSDATRNLIVECLKQSEVPLNTAEIKSFLEKHKNSTNPSVELSRMVKKGKIERAGRGMYQFKK